MLTITVNLLWNVFIWIDFQLMPWSKSGQNRRSCFDTTFSFYAVLGAGFCRECGGYYGRYDRLA
jgi:hypothetical protein